MQSQLTLVLGGAASGKSVMAEGMAQATGLPCHYIATARAGDAEMQTKIASHKARRGAGWTSAEAPQDVAQALANVAPGQVVLLDCATMWLANQTARAPDERESISTVIAALLACAAPVIVVSNELGQGVVPGNKLARDFRQTHGEMNQFLAAAASHVTLVVAGLPVVLKTPDKPGAI